MVDIMPTMHCPALGCDRIMATMCEQGATEIVYSCPRCSCKVELPIAERREAIFYRHRMNVEALVAAYPALATAMIQWCDNECYWDGKGYRLKYDRRRRAPWSKLVVELWPDCRDFAEAAHWCTQEEGLR
jgi:hypothetical protein